MRSSVDVSPPYARRELTRVLQAAALAALVLVAVVTQIPSSLSLRSSNAIRSPEASTTNKFEHMFATKTKYWNQRKDETDGDESAIARALVSPPVNADIFNGPPFHELELIQTQIVARHGIRYPTGGNIKEIDALLERLKPFEKLLPAWMKNYTLPYNLSVEGELAEAGEHELRKLGFRSLTRSGYENSVTYSKDKYRVTHTHVKRTRDSAIAFASRFFENAKDVEYIENPENKDILLRFFDQCARYQREVKRNQSAQTQLHQFQKSSMMLKLAQWLKQSLGLDNESIKFSAKDLRAVQSACAFDIALYHHKHHWCSLMSLAFIQSLDYLDDLEEFYWIGGGYKINYEMAAVLLREIFDTMRAKINGSTEILGSFFFAHAETTLPFMTLMGYGDRSPLLANATKADIKTRGFRTSNLSPFAANIEFRLYQLKSPERGVYVRILVNEKDAAIPGCGRWLCKLSDLEQQWHYYLSVYDFEKDCM